MSILVKDILKIIQNIAPESLAEDWDNSGIQLLPGINEIGKILICLEINEEVMKESMENGIDLIVTHHPLIFSPLKKITSENRTGEIIINLLKKNIMVYSAHTSFDSAYGGNNDYLAEVMGLENVRLLRDYSVTGYYKLIVFVPEESLDKVRNAICDAGAGEINNYSRCTFYHKGTGTFMPNINADPYIGKADKLEKVSEYRLESIVPGEKLEKVLSCMISAHPYEEPAYDVLKLENKINSEGLGRIGDLKQESTLEEICYMIKNKLVIEEPVSFVGTAEKRIKTIGICTGSGVDLLQDAINNGCQLFITGDVKYHDAHFARQSGIALIDAKHFHTEKIFVKNMADKLNKALNNRAVVMMSEANLNPFQYV